MKLGHRGANLITEFEELRLESYPDLGGVWTIGFGTTKLNGQPISAGMKINEPVAWALFYGDVQESLNHIEKVVRVSLNQNQIDALCSFTYNLGTGALSNSSLLQSINAKLIINEDLFTRWNKVRIGGVLKPVNGLTRRRKKEFDLFMDKRGL